MLKASREVIDSMETQYPGISKTIQYFENLDIPPCPKCGSEDTAIVQVGIIGRTIYIASVTTKFALRPNGPVPGKYYCNSCSKYFHQ